MGFTKKAHHPVARLLLAMIAALHLHAHTLAERKPW